MFPRFAHLTSRLFDQSTSRLAARIEARILFLRGQRVMLSSHLAELYGVEPKVLVQAVKRNLRRFPEDFMFQLSREEFANVKSQFVTSSWGGLRRATPYAFTEHGVAMLSSVLNSSREEGSRFGGIFALCGRPPFPTNTSIMMLTYYGLHSRVL